VSAPSCADVQSRLIDALDGRLDAATSMRFHAHLESCASCRDRAALWRSLTPQLRAAEPAPPDPMAIRRMQLEIERRLAGPSPLHEPARVTPPRAAGWWAGRRLALASMLAVAAAATLLALWFRPARRAERAGPAAYAAFTVARGRMTLSGRPVGPPGDQPGTTRVSVGAPLVLATGAAAELALDRGATVQVAGPARLSLQGTAAEVALRLDEGRVQVQVAHRRADETFAVITRDVRVEVRGTRFAVTAGPRGSRVEVTEGRVAVHFSDGRSLLVPAGKLVDSTSPTLVDANAPAGAPAEAPPAEATAPAAPAQAPAPLSCADDVRACRVTAQAVRDSMRKGDDPRALRLIADGDRQAREAAPRCGAVITACRDELGYLHAEALNQAGRAGDAIAAYRALDRRSAPAAMRQNALYAAAQIERQRGWAGRARADYERALAAAPRGALAEESLVGAMESAHVAGEDARARAFAARYLRSFPGGLASETARRLLGGGATP